MSWTKSTIHSCRLTHTLHFQTMASWVVIWHSYTGGQTFCWNLLPPYLQSIPKQGQQVPLKYIIHLHRYTMSQPTRPYLKTHCHESLNSYTLSHRNMQSVCCLCTVMLILLIENKVLNIKHSSTITNNGIQN
jgi:hypothetical protein